MSWLCKLFGHKISNHKPWYRYFRAQRGEIDGIGRQHISLYCECDRCGQTINFGMIHGDYQGIVTKQK